MNIPPVELPSNPQIKIHMREATTAEMMEFAGVAPDYEEKLTTLFLKKVQLPEHYSAPSLWTGDDRRLVLWWYYVHTRPEDDTTIPVEYKCGFCGDHHTYLFDVRDFAEDFKKMKGKPYREAVFMEKKILVRPHNGFDLEEIEAHRILVDAAKKEHGNLSGEYYKRTGEHVVLRAATCFRFADEPEDNEKDYEKALDARLAFVRELPGSLFFSLGEILNESLETLQHGLNTFVMEGKIYFSLPSRHTCPNDKIKENKTRLRVPFRCRDYVPTVLGGGLADTDQ